MDLKPFVGRNVTAGVHVGHLAVIMDTPGFLIRNTTLSSQISNYISVIVIKKLKLQCVSCLVEFVTLVQI